MTERSQRLLLINHCSVFDLSFAKGGKKRRRRRVATAAAAAANIVQERGQARRRSRNGWGRGTNKKKRC